MIAEEKAIIQITARFNDERTHRYLLRRQWNEENTKSATILMSNASNADIIQGDLTGMIIQNNLAYMEYSSVNIVNLFSYMTSKLDLSGELDELTDEENIQQILQSAKGTDVFIIAIGTLAKTYKKVAVYQDELFKRLREEGLQPKIHTIEAEDGSQGLHVLSSKLRATGSWKLVSFTLPEPPKEALTEKQQKEKNKKK
jgi:hypothetical protein